MEYYKVHKAASLVPLPTPAEQKALMEDIKSNGQQVPISLYRGKIVDGRSRQNACIQLGIGVDAKEIPNNMSLDEVKKYVKSVNTRRNLTRVQKAIVAMQSALEEKKPNFAKHAREWGVNPPEVSDAKYINEHRPEYIKILYDGGAIEYKDYKTNKLRKGSSLYPIRKSIEASIEAVIQKSQFIENNGDPYIAKGFDQLRSVISFLPEQIDNKTKIFMLRIIVSELENGK